MYFCTLKFPINVDKNIPSPIVVKRFGNGQDFKSESFLNSRIFNENCTGDNNDL